MLHKKIVKAELEISALGIFHIEINGKEISEYFMLGYTNYHKFVNLCAYDVTDMLDKEILDNYGDADRVLSKAIERFLKEECSISADVLERVKNIMTK